ncbi:MFS transporter [Candidatus Peregrinibacteria bacterium]|nr:MFS transporter [Candidatus Peregrinibacteria bacterium]
MASMMHLPTFLKVFYTYQFLHDFILIYAVDKLFFVQNGISLTQVATLLSIWAAASFLLEIPTGVLADKWNRRSMLILGSLFYAVCYSIWLLYPTFEWFLIGFIFRSLASTFSSGTLQAYTYDFLTIHKRQDLFEQIWGRGRAFNLAGLALGWVFGGIVSEYSYWWVLVLSAGAGVATTIAAFFFPNIQKQVPLNEPNPFHFLREGLAYAFTHRVILNVFLYTAIVRSSYAVIDEYWPILFQQYGMPNTVLGISVAVASLCGGFAGTNAHRFKKQPWNILNQATLYMSVVLIATAFVKSAFIIIFLLTFEVVLGVTSVLAEGVIQRNVAQHQRATMASVNAMFVEVAIVTGLMFGFISDKVGIQYGYGFFGIFILMYLVAQYFVNPRKLISA